ncbi:MAG: PilX N-terminal domain-containing pilus assembly protein [Acidobacteriota bacterium]
MNRCPSSPPRHPGDSGSRRPRSATPGHERGSALVISTLVMVILTLLGISYLTLADTETLIAVNLTYQEQALYAAESGTRMVVNWFNDPAATGVLVPTTSQVDRTKRWIDHDDNPTTATITDATTPVTEGDPNKPFYRDTTDDLFEKPYRGALSVAFTGTEDGPDLVIDADAGGNQAAYLTTVNTALFGTYPSDITITNAPDARLRARIVKIEIYQPPLVNLSGGWSRYGIATVKVTAGIFKNAADGDASNDYEVGRRVVKAVVNETPYPGPTGPLQSCLDLGSNGSFAVHWGDTSAVGNATIASNHDAKHDSTFPFAKDSASSHIYEDPNGAPGNSDLFDTWYANFQGQALEDPWFKFQAGGQINAYGTTDIQPFDPVLTTAPQDHSNLLQNLGTSAIRCPDFDYRTWKAIAQNGGKNVNYLVYDSTTQTFKLDGMGDTKSFRTWTEGQQGVFFFDTADGLPPASDGSNLTPAISISGAAWNSKGFIYLNAADFRTTGAGSAPTEWIFPPGEPYVDLNNNSQFDTGEPFVNLQYNSGNFVVDSTATQTVSADADGDGTAETYSTTVGRDTLGPPFSRSINMYGIFYTSGTFQAQGNFAYYGSVVGKAGVGPGSGTPDIYWDDRIVQGGWPPPGIDLPRVIISRWEVEL